MAKVSVASLTPADHEGWMTKQGGSVKSWKKRWFVLKGSQLFYFKTKKDTDLTGVVELTKESFVRREDKKKKYCFAVGTQKRIFYMYPDTQVEQDNWIKVLSQVVDKLKNPGGTRSDGGAVRPMQTGSTQSSGMGGTTVMQSPSGSSGGAGSDPLPPRIEVGQVQDPDDIDKPAGFNTPSAGVLRRRLDEAKNQIGFLQQEDSKVLEFWQIWSESVPPQEDVVEGAIIFQVSVAADMEKLSWRTSGPQNIFIQKMVDFFWNVGAPETEIDRLNDVGALINPIQIGSWIDMSAKGGMDGGWFFPVDVPMKFALEASDAGDPITRVAGWSETNEIMRCTSVGRDMGAAPPRQTEIRFPLSGEGFESQLQRALSAFEAFGFPMLPDDMLGLIRQSPRDGLSLSVITSSEGFVRLGLLCPEPDRVIVDQLCVIGGGNADALLRFEQALGVNGQAYAEYQYLMKGFGYGVYKEGFDVVFHYDVGEEGPLK